MAISLKRYDRQVGVSAESGTQAISSGLASSLIEDAGLTDKIAAQTFKMLGEKGSEIYKDFQKRNDEVELARINKEFLIESTAYQDQLELLNDEQEILDLSNHFMISQKQKIDSFKLSPEVKRQALISFDNNLTKQGVLASSRILKIGIEKQDNKYLDDENTAIATGDEVLYAEAQKNRVAIGTLSYEDSLKKIRTFNENASDGIFQQLLRAEKLQEAEELLYSKESKFSRDAYKENIILLEASKKRLEFKSLQDQERDFGITTQTFRKDLAEGNIPVQIIPQMEAAGIKVKDIEKIQAGLNFSSSTKDDAKQYKKVSKVVDSYKNKESNTTFADAYNAIYTNDKLTLTSKSELFQEIMDASDEMGNKNFGFRASGFSVVSQVKSTGWGSEDQKNSYIELNNNYERALAKVRNEEQFDRVLELYAEDRKKLNKYWKKNPNATPEEWKKVSKDYLGQSASFSVRQFQPITPEVNVPFKGNDGLTYIVTSYNEDGSPNFARVDD